MALFCFLFIKVLTLLTFFRSSNFATRSAPPAVIIGIFQQLPIEAVPKNTFIIAMHATPFISSYIKGAKASYQYYPMQKIMLKISQF